ncbi:MAG TPA: tetratricopeptide repeat protein [Rhizomicrobium sp.]|jgi:tetratricopeptide (TPR) repeat protein|nr:tetratricopeptide repeat protein [Rhizomicrobium sp.]
MKKILSGVLLALAMSGEASASGYSDFNAGVAAHNSGSADMAIRYLSAALNAPDLPAHLRPAALLDRAEAYAAGKQLDPAIADYTAALALDQSYAGYQGRAAAHLQKKEFDLARADYVSATRVRPELPNAYVGHGLVNLAERKFDDAIRDYTDALGATLGALSLYVLRGDAYRLAGRYDEAIKDYGVAIQQDAKYAEALIARGRAYQEQGAFRDALSDYKDALALSPKDAGLHQLAGIAQWELGRNRDAAENFARAGGDAAQSNYAFVWRYVAAQQPGPAGLSAQAAALDLKDWPGPLVRLILGTAKPDEVFASAQQGDADARAAKACDADFYVGEWQQLQGNGAEARRLFGEASASCRSDWPESRAAKTELQRLDAGSR